MCFVFFFQAEVGIRDVAVTGVQTCALPIWRRIPHRTTSPPARRQSDFCTPDCDDFPEVSIRSEERRVGKEGSARWPPFHETEKEEERREAERGVAPRKGKTDRLVGVTRDLG